MPLTIATVAVPASADGYLKVFRPHFVISGTQRLLSYLAAPGGVVF